jgi:hypothetical protein
LPLPASALDLPKGTVVVARSQPSALLIWDASPAVGDLVIAQTTGEAGMRALEVDALTILAAHAAGSPARHLDLRAQYAATGIVGAAYQASTFAQATPLVVVGADRTALLANASRWQRMVASGRMPNGLSIHVLGRFPVPH